MKIGLLCSLGLASMCDRKDPFVWEDIYLIWFEFETLRCFIITMDMQYFSNFVDFSSLMDLGVDEYHAIHTVW